MVKSTEIYLNLHKCELLGWEDEKSSLLIASMIEGIKLEYNFPPVNISRKENNTYWLNGCEGGHHRAIAHYIERVPLRCNLKKSNGFDCRIPIREIILDNWKNFHLKDSLILLPEDVAKKFCNENDLDFKEYYLDHKEWLKENGLFKKEF